MNKSIVLLTAFTLMVTILLGADYAIQEQKKYTDKQIKSENIIINQENNNQSNKNDLNEIPLNISKPNKIPVLMYHCIDYGSNSLYVSPEMFNEHINYLINNNFNFMDFNDLKSDKIPQNPIMLTFDDGYKDFYINAYPILKKNNIKATVYIIYNLIDTTGYLTTDNILEMKDLISFQSHTLSHADLKFLDKKEQEREIKESKEKIENLTGKKVISFSYPSSSYNDNVVQLAGKFYDYAVTTKFGTYYIDNDNLKIPRIRISKNNNVDDLCKLLTPQ